MLVIFQAKMRDEHEKETKKKNLVNNIHIEQNLTALPTSKPIDDDDLYNISPHLRYAKVKKVHTPFYFFTIKTDIFFDFLLSTLNLVNNLYLLIKC